MAEYKGITYEIDLSSDLVRLETEGLSGQFNLSIRDFQPLSQEEAEKVVRHFIDIGFIFVLRDEDGNPEDLFFPFSISALKGQALKAADRKRK